MSTLSTLKKRNVRLRKNVKDEKGIRVDVRAVIGPGSKPPLRPRSIVGYEESLVARIGESVVRSNRKVAIGKAMEKELMERCVCIRCKPYRRV